MRAPRGNRRKKALGPIDIVVNNAGIQYVAPIEEFPLAKWDQIITLNLTAAFRGRPVLEA
ncbi:MAG: SDR family NAD(P)-dependent oxidoreductase [Alphaproteobacteria bacterium]